MTLAVASTARWRRVPAAAPAGRLPRPPASATHRSARRSPRGTRAGGRSRWTARRRRTELALARDGLDDAAVQLVSLVAVSLLEHPQPVLGPGDGAAGLAAGGGRQQQHESRDRDADDGQRQPAEYPAWRPRHHTAPPATTRASSVSRPPPRARGRVWRPRLMRVTVSDPNTELAFHGVPHRTVHERVRTSTHRGPEPGGDAIDRTAGEDARMPLTRPTSKARTSPRPCAWSAGGARSAGAVRAGTRHGAAGADPSTRTRPGATDGTGCSRATRTRRCCPRTERASTDCGPRRTTPSCDGRCRCSPPNRPPAT